MRSRLVFLDADTLEPSDCAAPLEISVSGASLGIDGVIIERGVSPFFHPTNVITPYFYFALGLDESLTWTATQPGSGTAFTTFRNEIWFNPPQTPFTHRIDEPCNFIILAIDKERFLDASDARVPFAELQFVNDYQVVDVTLAKLLELLFEQAKNPSAEPRLLVDPLIKALANYFITHYSNYDELRTRVVKRLKIGAVQNDRIESYMDEHIREPYDGESLSRHLNMSRYHFIREYKKARGVSPYQRFVEKRIEVAQKLLLDPELTAHTIAHDLGFSDHSHFSRTFKKIVGVTPTAYREGRH